MRQQMDPAMLLFISFVVIVFVLLLLILKDFVPI